MATPKSSTMGIIMKGMAKASMLYNALLLISNILAAKNAQVSKHKLTEVTKTTLTETLRKILYMYDLKPKKADTNSWA